MAGGSRMTLTGTVCLSSACFSHPSSRLAQACSCVSGSKGARGFFKLSQFSCFSIGQRKSHGHIRNQYLWIQGGEKNWDRS